MPEHGDRVEPMAEDRSPESRVITELERCIRERDVRVPERMAILGTLVGEDVEATLSHQMTELREQLENTARKVRTTLS